MPNVEIVSPAEIGSSQLTLEKAHDLAFWAFAFSQGDNSLKRYIFEFAHSCHPEWKITNDLKTQLRAKLRKSASKHMQNSKRHIPLSLDRAGYTVPHVLVLMAEIFNSEENTYNEQGLFIGTIEADYKWMYENGGRPGREREIEGIYDDVKPIADPFLSFFCRYGIEGTDTRVPEYNQMFQRLARLGLKYSSGCIDLGEVDRELETPFRTKFNVVLLEYSNTHPQRSSSWSSEWLSRQ